MINKRKKNTIMVEKQEGRNHCEDLGAHRQDSSTIHLT
jgi:hypothetical protein